MKRVEYECSKCETPYRYGNGCLQFTDRRYCIKCFHAFLEQHVGVFVPKKDKETQHD